MMKLSSKFRILELVLKSKKFLTGLTFDYVAPENILHLCYGEQFLNNPKSDIWSLGVVFYRIFIENKKIVFPWSEFHQRKKRKYQQKLRDQIKKERGLKHVCQKNPEG